MTTHIARILSGTLLAGAMVLGPATASAHGPGAPVPPPVRVVVPPPAPVVVPPPAPVVVPPAPMGYGYWQGRPDRRGQFAHMAARRAEAEQLLARGRALVFEGRDLQARGAQLRGTWRWRAGERLIAEGAAKIAEGESLERRGEQILASLRPMGGPPFAHGYGYGYGR